MKLEDNHIKDLIVFLGFKPQQNNSNIYYKNYPQHNDYVIKINFNTRKIDYDIKIVDAGDLTTCNFEKNENFVVLECFDRLLEKGYPPRNIQLERNWDLGKKQKGKLDIFVRDKTGKDIAYLMIECKTWGEEYEKEKKKMLSKGGQLFGYFQQDKAAQYLCLYASRFNQNKVEFTNDIVQVDEQWRTLTNKNEVFEHWNKNFKDNGIFEEWANAYDVEIKSLRREMLKELTEEDSGRIFNQFAEILRHNVVSDKPNAFNKIFNLFLCKIVDEDRKNEEELKFQWLDSDTDEDLQNRLSDLYKQGMKQYLSKDVTDYNDKQVDDKLFELDAETRKQIREMFIRVRLHKNNEFAFKEVFDEKSFRENAIVVREVVELLQPYQIRYGHKQQFLGDFFELLLSTGLKQEAGQFFTPVPIAKFIVSSLPIYELIERKINNDEQDFLPYLIDYAAGSGHFLTESMDEIQKIIDELDPNIQKPSIKSKLRSWTEAPFNWCYDYIYGIEADYRLVKTAKVSCFLNGDGLANVIHANGLDHFQKSIDYKGKLTIVSQDEPKDNGQFDILVANPPYSVASFKNTLKFGKESFELYDCLSDDSSEIESLFIERTKQLLKPGGWAALILPSSILSNSGIYTNVREIILKYFNLKAIVEFGSNTFMATSTNTVTLFLERKFNNEWKRIEVAIKNFFAQPQEATVNGIEQAFTKYVTDVFENLELPDYISFINKKPNENVQKQEIFADYKNWFNSLAEVNNLKEKRVFLNKSKIEQNKLLNDLFYEKIFNIEQDRMLYFFLVYSQKTLVIKAGEKQAEKDFIGYEFSNRRGHEGIKIYRDENGKPTTKLYDENERLNPEKANSYIYRSFLQQDFTIHESLQKNITHLETLKLMSFKQLIIDKSISLLNQKKTQLNTKWSIAKLGHICNIKIGGTPSRKQNSYYRNGTNLWVSISEMNGNLILDTKEKITNLAVQRSNVKLVKAGTTLISFKLSIGKTAIAGKDLYTNEAIAALEVVNPLNVIDQYLFYLFNLKYIDLDKDTNNAFGKSLNIKILKEIKIPLPPKSIQEQIVNDISIIEQKEQETQEKLVELNAKLNNIFSNLDFPVEKLADIAEFKNGLNYSENSTGDLVTMVGVKDFLENFSVNLDKLVDVRIDGKLNESYKLKPGDILMVRSNGSANLIGRFIYIDKLVKDTSYSGFTIRIRVKDKEVNSKYLCYCLRTENVRSTITKNPQGANIKSINQMKLSSITVPIAPIEEQLKIISTAQKIEKKIILIEKELSAITQNKQQILIKYLI